MLSIFHFRFGAQRQRRAPLPHHAFTGHWRAAGIALVDPIGNFEASGTELAIFDKMSDSPIGSGMTPARRVGDTGSAPGEEATADQGQADALCGATGNLGWPGTNLRCAGLSLRY
jgi:hypothetical protein